MADYLEQLRDNYREMDTEEIVARVKGGALTAKAHSVALQELAERGTTSDSLPKQPIQILEIPNPKPGLFVRAWSGKEPLWLVFWVLGVLFNMPFGVAWAIRHSPVSLAFDIIGIPCRLFWLGCVWRSAFRSSHWGWAVIARSYVVMDLAISALIVFGLLT